MLGSRGVRLIYMLNVFVDFHHASLLQSLILLFEGRLHGQVYRPIGVDWFTQGYWKVYDHPATVEQYLGIGGNTPDGTEPLNNLVDDGIKNKQRQYEANRQGVYICRDIDSGTANKAITLDGFLNRHFDIVIASLPAHVEPFKKLCELHPDHPKLIFQIGNSWTSEAAQAPNIMASAIIQGVPENVNFISYHQEFDIHKFCPTVGEPDKNIYSFVNCFDVAGHFASDYQLFTQVESAMPDWSFKIYGGQCRDNPIGPAEKLAKKMQEARFIWHTKNGGDGYGHVIHNAPAVGRPLIVKKEYYKGKLAEPLLIDEVTCIAIDGLGYEQIINKINYYSEPNEYAKMCRATYNNFEKVVNFDAEAEKIKEFLAKLI